MDGIALRRRRPTRPGWNLDNAGSRNCDRDSKAPDQDICSARHLAAGGDRIGESVAGYRTRKPPPQTLRRTPGPLLRNSLRPGHAWAARVPGRAADPAEAALAENRLGHDFSSVRADGNRLVQRCADSGNPGCGCGTETDAQRPGPSARTPRPGARARAAAETPTQHPRKDSAALRRASIREPAQHRPQVMHRSRGSAQRSATG